MTTVCASKTFTITLSTPPAEEPSCSFTVAWPTSAAAGEELYLPVTINNTSNIDIEVQAEIWDVTSLPGTLLNTQPMVTWENINLGEQVIIDIAHVIPLTGFATRIKMPNHSVTYKVIVCCREKGWV